MKILFYKKPVFLKICIRLNEVKYKRYKRSPTASNLNVSKTMNRIKAKNTKPELIIRKRLWQKGIKGYRLPPKNIPGRPDICFTTKKIAIFVNEASGIGVLIVNTICQSPILNFGKTNFRTMFEEI